MAQSKSEQKGLNIQMKKFSHDHDSKSVKVITRRANGTLRVATENNDASMTDPQWSEEADVNYIMEKFQKTGVINHRSKKQGIYADVSEIPTDLTLAATKVRESQLRFDSLPSHIREKFKNDPQNMINYLQDPKNHEEAAQLGLLTKVAKNDELNDENKAPQNKVQKADPPKPPDQQ